MKRTRPHHCSRSPSSTCRHRAELDQSRCSSPRAPARSSCIELCSSAARPELARSRSPSRPPLVSCRAKRAARAAPLSSAEAPCSEACPRRSTCHGSHARSQRQDRRSCPGSPHRSGCQPSALSLHDNQSSTSPALAARSSRIHPQRSAQRWLLRPWTPPCLKMPQRSTLSQRAQPTWR